MNGIKHTACACSRSIRYIITVQLEYNKTYYQRSNWEVLDYLYNHLENYAC